VRAALRVQWDAVAVVFMVAWQSVSLVAGGQRHFHQGANRPGGVRHGGSMQLGRTCRVHSYTRV